MTRQQKYPDTKYFHYHNQNPKGRLTTDCVIRAISTATKKPYNDVCREMAELQCSTGFDMSSPEAIDRYMKSLGWVKHKQPRRPDGKKYTGKEFCYQITNYDCEIDGDFEIGSIVANLGGNHTVAIMQGQVWDTWDSTEGCIGNFWTKK